jgi:hypothetical protein
LSPIGGKVSCFYALFDVQFKFSIKLSTCLSITSIKVIIIEFTSQNAYMQPDLFPINSWLLVSSLLLEYFHCRIIKRKNTASYQNYDFLQFYEKLCYYYGYLRVFHLLAWKTLRLSLLQSILYYSLDYILLH